VSSVISDIDDDFPNFAWWTLVYMFGCIVGVFITVATDTVFTYHVAITGFMAAALVFTTSSVNSLIYYSDAPKEAGAAGFILLSMVSVSSNRSLSAFQATNIVCRSSGSSTTARNHRHRTGRLWTRMPCTRKAAHPAGQARAT